MAVVDKNKAIIEFLLSCPQIQQNPLFFNFLNAKDNNRQIITQATPINKPYIDGSVPCRYTFTIVDFKSVVYQAIPKIEGHPNENVDDLADVQEILDWIVAQADACNFPNFGEDCVIDDMRVTTNTPNLNGVDTSVTPALAKYSMSIQVDYIDNTKKIWQ